MREEEETMAGETAKNENSEAVAAQDGDLAAQLEEALAKNRELEDRLLRLAAEQDNFKKRMQRERESLLKYAEESLLKDILPSLDNLERAVEQCRCVPDAAALLTGVEMTCKGLLNTLERFGLTPLSGEGQPFDPNFHEAVAMEHSEEVPENHILQEYQKGYRYKDRLIRAAKVVVSKGSPQQEQ